MDLNEIVNKYNLKLLLTFGSFGTERFTQHSDIDVAYFSKRVLTAEEELQMMCDLIMYFERDKIDLVNLAKAVPLLMYEIACNSRVLYEEDENLLKFKMKASARYADTRYLRNARRKYLQEQIDSMDIGKQEEFYARY